MTATALFSYFAPDAIYSFPTICGSFCSCMVQLSISANGLSHLLQIRVHRDFIPVVFGQFSFAFILWFVHSNRNLFRLFRSHLFSTSGLGPPAKYLRKVHIEENTWIHVLGLVLYMWIFIHIYIYTYVYEYT